MNTGEQELERLAEDNVEAWHKENNWVPTDRSCMPSIASFKAGYRAAQSQTELLRKRVEKLEYALKSLANEATGFKSMANVADHGNTNMSVLQHWIDNARSTLADDKASEGDK